MPSESYEAKVDRFKRYPIRVCRWMNECCLCNLRISEGNRYYDGGYGRRAHVSCLERLEFARGDMPKIPEEPTP